LQSRKVQELLCYLLLYRDCNHSREVLAEKLWANRDASQSKKYLRQTLWQLQAAVDSQRSGGNTHFLRVDANWIALSHESDLWLDVVQLEHASSLVQGVSGRTMSCEMAAVLEGAVELYRGDLLEGWYQDWCVFERERLQNMYLVALEKLISFCEAQQSYDTGLAHASRILRCDRARERTHRRVMRLYALSGNRSAALRQYESCAVALAEELAVQPSHSTVCLYEQIRDDRFVTLGTGSPGGPQHTGEVNDLLSDVLDRLRRAKTALAQVQEDIETVESAMRTKFG
jgi:DNA-binding SARP family transcriptional activator